MNVDSAVLNKLAWGIGVMAVVIAAGISAIFQLIGGFLERRAADKRHLRDLALKAAIVSWEKDIERAKLRSGVTRRPENTLPLDTHIIHMLQLVELISRKKLTVENVEMELMKIRIFSGAASKAARSEGDKHADGDAAEH